MWRHLLTLALLFGLVLPASGQVTAEHLFRPGTVAVSLVAGGAAFTAFQRVRARPETGNQEFDRRLSASTTGALGVDLIWWARRHWGLRGHASFMPSSFTVEHDEAGEAWLREQSGGDQLPTYGGLRVWVADVAAVIRPPLPPGRINPYALIGVGLVSYRPRSRDGVPPEAAAVFGDGDRTAGAAVFGLGAAVPLQRGNLLLSFGLTDHITRSPVAESDETMVYRDLANGLVLDPNTDRARTHLASNVRLLVGLTIPLRRRLPPVPGDG